MPSPRVTLGQIAARAGVHVTTVSLALRGSLKLPEATRKRLCALAEEMGYRPDPALNALNAYRANVHAPTFQATIACINTSPNREPSLSSSWLRGYHSGASRRAKELGYKLEDVWLHEPGVTTTSLSRRLLARGIRSLLVFPMPEPGPMPAFNWEEFSAVAFGYSITSPRLHRVTNHQFGSTLILLRELRALGYRRIGMCLSNIYDRRVNFGSSSGYAAYDRALPPEERVPVLVHQYQDDLSHVTRWLADHRPEAVISQNFHLWDVCVANGLRVPEDIGLAYMALAKGDTLLSGVYQNDEQIGLAAVDFLVAMIHRNERGVPAIAQHILIDGEWAPCRSTRRVGPPAPWFLDTPVPSPAEGPSPLPSKTPRKRAPR